MSEPTGELKRFENRVEIKDFDVSKKTVRACVSSIKVDRDEEIILPSAFEKRIGNYKANPILCWGHPLSDWVGTKCVPENLIGRALGLEISANEVNANFEYAYDINERARLCFDLVSAGFLKAYSIGAMAFKYTFMDDPEEELLKLPGYAYDALKNGLAWLCHTDMELLEISQVFCGSNRDALSKGLAAGILTRKQLRDLVEGREMKRAMQVPVIRAIQSETVQVPVKISMVVAPEVKDFISVAVKSLSAILDAIKTTEEQPESVPVTPPPAEVPEAEPVGEIVSEDVPEESKCTMLADFEEMKRALAA